MNEFRGMNVAQIACRIMGERRALQVSRSSDRRSWEISVRREGVSATVYEVLPGFVFSTATEARQCAERMLGVRQRWQRNMGRGSTYWRAVTAGKGA